MSHSAREDITSQTANFEERTDAHPTTHRILERRSVVGIPIHVEEAMTNLVPRTDTATHKRVDSRLPAIPDMLIKYLVETRLSHSQIVLKSRKLLSISLDRSEQQPASSSQKHES